MNNSHVSAQIGHPFRVFVVDDEPVIAETLALILRREGFAAEFFTYAPAALEHARVYPPDLLISDVVMPGFSGIELAIQITEQYPACRVLLFSGQAATADLLAMAQSRGYEFTLLQKPIYPTDLLRMIGHLVA